MRNDSRHEDQEKPCQPIKKKSADQDCVANGSPNPTNGLTPRRMAVAAAKATANHSAVATTLGGSPAATHCRRAFVAPLPAMLSVSTVI